MYYCPPNAKNKNYPSQLVQTSYNTYNYTRVISTLSKFVICKPCAKLEKFQEYGFSNKSELFRSAYLFVSTIFGEKARCGANADGGPSGAVMFPSSGLRWVQLGELKWV
jgi:hypothetical protein